MSPLEVALGQQQHESEQRLAQECFPLDQLLDDLLQCLGQAALQEFFEQRQLPDEDQLGWLAVHDRDTGCLKQERESLGQLVPALDDVNDSLHNVLLDLEEDGGAVLFLKEDVQGQPVLLRRLQEQRQNQLGDLAYW